MELGKDDLSIIIKRVMEEMSVRDLGIKDSDGTFDTMEEAIDAAYTAQKKLLNFSIEERERLIAAMRKAIVDSAMEIATLAVSETGMGRIDHKYLKMKLVAEKTPGTEVLKADVYTGDKGLTLIERGAFGVIGAITPSTNPAATVACNAIGMIAGGNTVVFAPHPGSYNILPQDLPDMQLLVQWSRIFPDEVPEHAEYPTGTASGSCWHWPRHPP